MMTDWSVETADTIERVISGIREKSVIPAQKAVRAIVFGVVIAVLAIIAAVALFFGAFRLVDHVLPGKAWATHLVFAAVFFLIGGLLWSRRTSPTPK